MPEVELKLGIDENFKIPSLEGTNVARTTELTRQTLEATYYDTSDLRLTRWGASLRYRTGDDGGAAWTVKLPRRDGDRDELVFEGDAARVPQQARAMVTAFVRSGRLRPLVTLRTDRSRWALGSKGGKSLAEMAVDDVTVLRGGRVKDRFRELEVELRDGTRGDLSQIGEKLRTGGAVEIDQIPKVIRALDAAELPPDVVPYRPAKTTIAGDVVRASIADATIRIIENDPAVRRGDQEAVHQMRVGTRRLRSDLSTLQSFTDEDRANGLRKELKWLADLLGRVRDTQVLSARLRDRSSEIKGTDPIFALLADREVKARGALARALGSGRYRSLLDTLVRASQEPPLSDRATTRVEALPHVVEARWAKLRDAASQLTPTSSARRFHEVRISAKKARYAAEAVTQFLDKDRSRHMKGFASALADLQDALGEQHDGDVARTFLMGVAKGNNEAGLVFIAARIYEREASMIGAAKAASLKAWAKTDRKKNLKWLT